MELDGQIVEFVDSGALRLGYVRKREHRKVQIVDQRGRQTTVPTSRVIVVHGSSTEDKFRSIANDILKSVEQCAEEIDPELLWESVRTSNRNFTVAELATHFFGTSSSNSEAAMFRVLERETLFFRRHGNEFCPRPEDQVGAERVRQERAREKEQFRNRVADVLRHALAGNTSEDQPEWDTMAPRLERWLRLREKDEVGAIFEQIVGKPQAREAAYDLLVRMGRIEESDDRLLVIRGFPTVFPPEAERAAAKLEEVVSDSQRVDWTQHPAIAIDDEGTVEVDDAITVIEEDGQTIVGIHIADVSAFTDKGDALDREASRRTATIYLPNISVPMFPPRLSSDLSSLKADRIRPAFTIEARFDEGDALVDFKISRSLIKVSQRLTYEAVDRALADGRRSLARLHQIAKRLHDSRVEAGAQTHRRPEIKVKVVDGTIFVNQVNVDTPSRLIVSELMILANQLAADNAIAKGIPVIYRTQEAPDADPPDVSGLPEALQFEVLRRNFKRSRLSLTPAPHSGLGLSAYTQMSSPIRRYADLVTQRQFAAVMRGDPPPYESDELVSIINAAEAAEVEIRRLEQSSTSYWVLTYLSNEKMKHSLPAMVLDNRGTVELIDYLVRGKVPASDESTKGDVVSVEIDSVRPATGDIRFRVCI
jgi:exoribonuclease-2